KSLVHALRSHIGQHKEARECIQYIWKNRRRMRYPGFEKQGFCTSTGVVESGCKLVVGTRLKRQACTGPSRAPTPSSPCAAASSADASKISGNAAQSESRWLHDFPKSDVRPSRGRNTSYYGTN